jgi:hypothetical protein
VATIGNTVPSVLTPAPGVNTGSINPTNNGGTETIPSGGATPGATTLNTNMLNMLGLLVNPQDAPPPNTPQGGLLPVGPSPYAPAQQLPTQAQQQGSPPATPFDQQLQQTTANMPNGLVTAQQIDNAVRDPNVTGNQAAMVAALKETLPENQQVVNLDNVQNLRSNTNTGQALQENYARAQSKIANANRELFNGSPDYNALHQGSLGDCYFLSALDGKAQKDPQAVQRMMSQNADGSYQVNLPGASPQHVAPVTDGQIGVGTTTGQNGVWGTVAEQAWEQARPQNQNNPNHRYDTDQGGQLAQGVEAVTGHVANQQNLSDISTADLRSQLVSAQQNGKVVTAGTPHSFGNPPSDQSGDLYAAHAYTVTNYNAKTDEITVRNPWGTRYHAGQANGRNDDPNITMKLSDFQQQFKNVAFETDQPLPQSQSQAGAGG